MDFDWKSLGPVIAPLAPGLGSLIGGLIPFPGGSYAGQKLGEIIAAKFGVPATPAAVADAIKNNPNEVVLARLQAVTEEAKVYWPALAEMEKAWAQALSASAAEVNQTMRVEIQPENRHPYYTGWRPAAGWLFVILCALAGLVLMTAAVQIMWKGGDVIGALERIQVMVASLLGALGLVVGVLTHGRSQEKRALTEAAVATVAPAPTPPVAKRK